MIPGKAGQINKWAGKSLICQSISLAGLTLRLSDASLSLARVWVTSGPRGLAPSLVVLSLQRVIVTLWARSMVVVMARDFVSVRLERQGLSVMSVCREIPGAPAVNVSNRAAAPCLPQHGSLRVSRPCAWGPAQSRKRPNRWRARKASATIYLS